MLKPLVVGEKVSIQRDISLPGSSHGCYKMFHATIKEVVWGDTCKRFPYPPEVGFKYLLDFGNEELWYDHDQLERRKT